jgi:hypothetical protein
MTDTEHEDTRHEDTRHEDTRRLAEASRAATTELYKQGTPEYDGRAHQHAVELERKAAEAVEVAEAAERESQEKDATSHA